MGYRSYVFKEYLSAFTFNFVLYTTIPALFFVIPYNIVIYFWPTWAVCISSVISLVSFIINCMVIGDGNHSHVFNRAGRFDPLTKEEYNKIRYEKSFGKMIK